ncbi:MAG: alpha/beta fold hydrolase [Myxococcales bacterium]|nr:alpha/beta fold hydrolase [Myxococcales bacterium]
MRRLAWFLLLGACSSSSPAAIDAGVDADTGPSPEDHVFGGDRPVVFFRSPEGADPKKPLPLIVVLHGYGASGLLQSVYFRLDKLVDEKQFLLVAPDGSSNKGGPRFWAAVDGCCEADGKKVDDVKWIKGLVDEIASVWTVDPKRIFLVGHSNGGAMAYRLACEPSHPFAAAFLLAPAFFEAHTACAPTQPISIRHLHGTADETVAYDGGTIGLLGPTLSFVSAPKAVAAFAAHNGCAATPDESAPAVDLDLDLPGAETKPARYLGCRDGVATELYTLAGAKHVPLNLTPELGRQIWSFFEAHPRR